MKAALSSLTLNLFLELDNAVLDNEPSSKTTAPKFTPLKLSKTPPPTMPTVFVPVYRTEETQAARLKLPILAEEQPIVEAIKENAVVIICGETGSGKTTQVPQFLYEAGFCVDGRLIGITEPRRVAAISMSKRVAEEMNLDSSVVSYQIRYEGNVTEKTLIKFMTDGVLLKEIQKDFLLSKYSAIIIDEAHERSMYSDILIGLLSRIVPLREKRGEQPLKLIIMSATLRVEDFAQKNLFRNRIPPVIQVESRQFPVTIYFNRVTEENYLAAAYRKISHIHKLAPPDGGILVFVSGQREVTSLVRWLTRRFPIKKARNEDEETAEDEVEAEKKAAKQLKKMKRKKKHRLTVKDMPTVDLDAYEIRRSDLNGNETSGDRSAGTTRDEALDFLESDVLDLGLFEDDEEMELDELDLDGRLGGQKTNDPPLYCLPLYSLLSSEKQRRVFQPPPPGCRMCVVATNVAETSLTIPGIKYVVDTGKEKVRIYDGVAGVSKFMVQWISKASANQRAGRAGRTSAGHCYRLYSSAVFSDFETFSRPEILNKPVDELVLQMKNMNILKVINFPFPTAPERETLKAAEERLTKLGALMEIGQLEKQLKITNLGRTIALFPVKPEFGKMLALGNQYDILPYVVCLVAILSVREPMKIVEGSETDGNDKEKNSKAILQLRRSWATGSGRHSQLMLLGDVSVMLRAMVEFEKETGDWTRFCQRCGVRLEAMIEAKKMRRQLTEIINRVAPDISLSWTDQLKEPNERQALLLRQILLAGLGENVAVKMDADAVTNANEKEKKKLKKAYRTARMKDFVYIHPNSVLSKTQPRYVIYQEIVETTRKYLHTVTAVESEWLPVYAQNYAFGNLV